MRNFNIVNNKILNIKSKYKKYYLFIIDSILVFITMFVAYYLRVGDLKNINILNISILSFISIIILQFIFQKYKFYFLIIRFFNSYNFDIVLKSFILYSSIFTLVIFIFNLENIPKTIGIIQSLLLFSFIILIRLVYKTIIDNSINSRVVNKKAIVIGSVEISTKIINDLKNELIFIKILSSDEKFHYRIVNGVEVLPSDHFKLIVENSNLDLIIIADDNKLDIVNLLRKIEPYNIGVLRFKEGLYGDLIKFKLEDYSTAEISLKPVEKINYGDIVNFYKNKTILITGAGGTIGSQITLEICKNNIDTLVIIEMNEYNLFSIINKIENICINNNIKLITILGSINDENCLNEIFINNKINYVFHAAAYKHVHIVENNSIVSFKNNCLGTELLCKYSQQFNVEKFLFISTDKAVNPSSMMGASKRVAELIVLNYASKKSDTHFNIIRFGNVLNSSGSVIPKFINQINNEYALSVTHPDVTRYFMTIEEACFLCVLSCINSKSGDIFILEMGKPEKILDLAKRIVKLSGKKFSTSESNILNIKAKNQKDLEILINFPGLKPGEKLFEKLSYGDVVKTNNQRILKGIENNYDNKEIELLLNDIIISIKNNNTNFLKLVLKKYKILI